MESSQNNRLPTSPPPSPSTTDSLWDTLFKPFTSKEDENTPSSSGGIFLGSDAFSPGAFDNASSRTYEGSQLKQTTPAKPAGIRFSPLRVGQNGRKSAPPPPLNSPSVFFAEDFIPAVPSPPPPPPNSPSGFFGGASLPIFLRAIPNSSPTNRNAIETTVFNVAQRVRAVNIRAEAPRAQPVSVGDRPPGLYPVSTIQPRVQSQSLMRGPRPFTVVDNNSTEDFDDEEHDSFYDLGGSDIIDLSQNVLSIPARSYN